MWAATEKRAASSLVCVHPSGNPYRCLALAPAWGPQTDCQGPRHRAITHPAPSSRKAPDTSASPTDSSWLVELGGLPEVPAPVTGVHMAGRKEWETLGLAKGTCRYSPVSLLAWNWQHFCTSGGWEGREVPLLHMRLA